MSRKQVLRVALGVMLVSAIKRNETPAITMTTDADLAVHASGGLEQILHISLDDVKRATTRYFVQNRASLLDQISLQWR